MHRAGPKHLIMDLPFIMQRQILVQMLMWQTDASSCACLLWYLRTGTETPRPAYWDAYGTMTLSRVPMIQAKRWVQAKGLGYLAEVGEQVVYALGLQPLQAVRRSHIQEVSKGVLVDAAQNHLRHAPKRLMSIACTDSMCLTDSTGVRATSLQPP